MERESRDFLIAMTVVLIVYVVFQDYLIGNCEYVINQLFNVINKLLNAIGLQIRSVG